METVQYIIIANICLIISYLYYKMISKNETNFRQLRFFLLGSIFISFLLPLNSFKINSAIIPTKSIVSNPTYTQQLSIQDDFVYTVNYPNLVTKKASLKNMDWILVIKIIYISVSILLIFNVFTQITQLFYRYYKSEKSKYLQFTILSNTYYKNSFSFFNWIFINKETCLNEDRDKIIAHEIIHASQYHSFDLILIELLSAVMWFNPVIWMMRKSMQLLHEYLADEGALGTGIDKLKYQALLINQLTEEKLICISSSFNHSLIKKRMIMMTKSKFNQKSKLKILALLPLSAMLFIIIAIGNGLFPISIKASPKTLNKILSSTTIKIRQSRQTIFVEDTTKKIKVVGYGKEKTSTEIRVIGYGDAKNQKDSNQLIYVVDGVQTENIEHLNPDSIESVNVLNQDNVVVIRTKDFRTQNNGIEIKNTNSNDMSNVLYIVDGVETLLDPFSIMNPDNIKSISVVKDKSLKALYPNKNYDGLIIIETKSKQK